MRIIGESHIGMVRKENQDAFRIDQPDQELCFGVVCDGMGGAKGGSYASMIAVGTANECFDAAEAKKNPEQVLKNIALESNVRVYRQANENKAFQGMGTTMVAAIARKNQVELINVGDSRAYHITNGNITQITKDHSAVQELVDSGHLTERQAKIHPNKNIITRAIGIEADVDVDSYSVDAEQGDIIILCSDGLSNFVDENEIHFEVSGGLFEDLPKRLIDLANSRGGTDNITVVAIEI
ncbi:MAG: Stp1/IreP family PP2C-type Ser/Thr phosphatase [Clostridia bacterium]|nr:Stp1/IreP family PP2C-type Ser/Thr phosphatase [Clostridia bacterium]